VDRAAIPSIVGSGVTVWGEDPLPAVPLPPLRRLDVAKAFHGLWGAVVLSALAYPVLPGATRYAMDALKRSVHNCHVVRIDALENASADATYGSRAGNGVLLITLRHGRR
jgi:hypothetical protein